MKQIYFPVATGAKESSGLVCSSLLTPFRMGQTFAGAAGFLPDLEDPPS